MIEPRIHDPARLPLHGQAPPNRGSRVRPHPLQHHGVLLTAVAGAALVPWIALLATSLPMRHAAHHWRITWVGFDVALAGLFLAAALAGRRRSEAFPDLLVAAGVVLVCDAWFDVITASTTHELMVSGAEALAAELPIALTCFALARLSRHQHPIVPARGLPPRAERPSLAARRLTTSLPAALCAANRRSESGSTEQGAREEVEPPTRRFEVAVQHLGRFRRC
jgi:hypothetical protein